MILLYNEEGLDNKYFFISRTFESGSGWWRNLMSRAKKNITETKVLSQIF